MQVIKAPGNLNVDGLGVFLAGSIEMGKAEDWQTKLTNELADSDVLVLNPRRDDWDSSWEQKKDNPAFREQVLWELNALNKAKVIVMYFSPDTMSPISLLELGLFAASAKLIVCCPEGFWKKGNVDVVCERFDVVQVEKFEDLAPMVKTVVEILNSVSYG